MALRPWSSIPINDAGEPMVMLPEALWRLEPHPYQRLGAPYGQQASPFQLRRSVVARLLRAQRRLQRQQPLLRLAIFDAWRPLAVQRFMVDHATAEECARRGVNPALPSAELERICAEVGRFWAPPSADPATPPPHSTGAAVDLTLADAAGVPLDMGGEIDAIGPISEPDFYGAAAAADPHGAEAQWHHRRQLLAEAMGRVGFSQHPNEWWHFSWGDQLWAWRSQAAEARYGRVPERASSLNS